MDDRAESLRLTYATTDDPMNVRAHSGTVYHVARALEAQGTAIEYLGELAKYQVFANGAINKPHRAHGGALRPSHS